MAYFIKNGYYIKYVEDLVKNYGTKVVIRRNAKVDDGYGGYTNEELELKEEAVIYNFTVTTLDIVDAGKNYRKQTSIRLLGTKDCIIKERDEVIIGDLIYKVSTRKDYQGICMQYELERKKNGEQ